MALENYDPVLGERISNLFEGLSSGKVIDAVVGSEDSAQVYLTAYIGRSDCRAETYRDSKGSHLVLHKCPERVTDA